MAREFTARMAEALDGMILATDLADYLAKKGVPFRECHLLVGRLVRDALSAGKQLQDVDLETLRSVCDRFGPDVEDVLSPERSTQSRNLPGGTGREAVLDQIEEEE